MNPDFAITLKGQSYSIPNTYRTDIQQHLTLTDTHINSLKSQLVDLNNKKKNHMIDLLNERQLIIYNNQLPKLSGKQLHTHEKFLKLKELLQTYDTIYGRYYKPEIGH
jgi:hypothetical protein